MLVDALIGANHFRLAALSDFAPARSGKHLMSGVHTPSTACQTPTACVHEFDSLRLDIYRCRKTVGPPTTMLKTSLESGNIGLFLFICYHFINDARVCRDLSSVAPLVFSHDGRRISNMIKNMPLFYIICGVDARDSSFVSVGSIIDAV